MKCIPLIIGMIVCAPIAVNGDGDQFLCFHTFIKNIRMCESTFIRDLRYPKYKPMESYQSRNYCCAFRHLKDCIAKHVGDKCGDTQMRQLVDIYIQDEKRDKKIATTPGDCDDYQGFRGAVLCQQGWLLIAEVIGLGIIFLVFVSAVVIKLWQLREYCRGQALLSSHFSHHFLHTYHHNVITKTVFTTRTLTMKCSSLSITLIISVAMSVVVTAIYLNDLHKQVSSTNCTVMSGTKLLKCGGNFIRELQELGLYKARGDCCAINHLKTCIVDNVDNCGDRKDEVVDQLVSSVVDTVKDISVSSGDCDLFTGYVGTVLCQPDWLLIVKAIVYLVIASAVVAFHHFLHTYQHNVITKTVFTTRTLTMKCSPLIIAMIICALIGVNGLFDNYDLDLMEVFKGAVTKVRCATTSMTYIRMCGNTFIHEIRHSEYRTRGYCCALKHLKDCIVEHVGDKCGDTEMRQLADHFFKRAKTIATPSGHCGDYRGVGGAVLCQPDWLLIAEAIGLGIVFLAIVSAMVIVCWVSRDSFRWYLQQWCRI
ncbi:unnamed protein product [Oppiella nova]|uniref:Uncharacterized protein n=1 Tax=Oppiella nova TaxID=334625 RepID=A0A7R9QK31_9ACAR|nr:unnamed protein product [Oppiella nova]CAG2166589.1 unnamed protein product [Oppiella nova]